MAPEKEYRLKEKISDIKWIVIFFSILMGISLLINYMKSIPLSSIFTVEFRHKSSITWDIFIWNIPIEKPQTGDLNIDLSWNNQFILSDENCDIINTWDYKIEKINKWIWKTPSQEEVSRWDFTKSSAKIEVKGEINEVFVCIMATLDPKDKALSYGRLNSLYFIVNRPEYWGHINAISNPGWALQWDGIFYSQDAPRKYLFSLENLKVAKHNASLPWQDVVNPIEQIKKWWNMKIISFVSKYNWWMITDMKFIYKGSWTITRISGM